MFYQIVYIRSWRGKEWKSKHVSQKAVFIDAVKLAVGDLLARVRRAVSEVVTDQIRDHSIHDDIVSVKSLESFF